MCIQMARLFTWCLETALFDWISADHAHHMLPGIQATTPPTRFRRQLAKRVGGVVAWIPPSAHHLTCVCLSSSAKKVDPAVVTRRESVQNSGRRQGAIEQGVGATPCRELRLGASAGTQAVESHGAHQNAGQSSTHSKEGGSAAFRLSRSFARFACPNRR
jgi:hypothetical protein